MLARINDSIQQQDSRVIAKAFISRSCGDFGQFASGQQQLLYTIKSNLTERLSIARISRVLFHLVDKLRFNTVRQIPLENY